MSFWIGKFALVVFVIFVVVFHVLSCTLVDKEDASRGRINGNKKLLSSSILD